MARRKKTMGAWEVWSWVALGVLVLIVLIEATFSLTNAWELSTLTTNLKRYSSGASVLLEEKARMAQEALMEKEEMKKEMLETVPAGMVVMYTEPETNVTFMVDPSGKYTDPSQYAMKATTDDDDVIRVTFEKRPAGTEDPNDGSCTTTFEISTSDRAVVTRDIVFRNPLYTVTTKDACGIIVDIKR